MANLEGGKFDKFLVTKVSDAVNALTIEEFDRLNGLLLKIQGYRGSIGKPIFNNYLVINVDEPYADEVIEIMKRHDHWG